MKPKEGTDLWHRHRLIELERDVIKAAVRAKRTLKECSRITAGGSDEEVEALVASVEAYEKEKNNEHN